MASKTVVIRREESSLEGLPRDIARDSKKTLSSVFRNGRPLELRGDGVDKLLESILGLRTDEPGFIARRETFWKELTLKVPFGGRELEIGTSENGQLLNPKQWLVYKWAMNHPLVAQSVIKENGTRISAEENMKSNPFYRFCLIDTTDEKRVTSEKLKIEQQAAKMYFEDRSDIEKAKILIRYLSPGTDVFVLEEEDVKDILFELSRSLPEKYINASNDKNIAIRAEISNMREAGVITRTGNTYIYIDETIGNNESQVVAWFRNPANSRSLLGMRAQLDQYMTSKYKIKSTFDSTLDRDLIPSLQGLPEDPDPIVVEVPGDMPPGTDPEALAQMHASKEDESATDTPKRGRKPKVEITE